MSKKKQSPKLVLVQSRNPKTNRYVLIDRERGEIIESKETPGPYEGVPIARKKRSFTSAYASEIAERYIKEHPDTFKKLAER